ncbi:Dabb family protein [Paenibacillus sp. YN15]|uniref:Dabb family protein n=1 Tax=Paenibacillus sp. YN15 TaxID=1742774 RepID=UPI000DCD6E47|nr:Dabb family protein [Paenibacillus sp. YN15]RAV02418.1 Dabb family protein [Paenibacillus sp. YN15]
MLRHVVLFKLADPTPDKLQEVKDKLLSLKGRVPQLLDIEVGIDVVRSERSYDVALITTFASLEDMNAYQVHPYHVEVGSFIATVRQAAAAVDFIID